MQNSNKKVTKLKYLLLEKGIMQSQLVDTINKFSKKNKIGYDSISKIVNGKKDMRISTLLRICRALNVTPNDIIDYDKKNGQRNS